jgi:hypothetical protein
VGRPGRAAHEDRRAASGRSTRGVPPRDRENSRLVSLSPDKRAVYDYIAGLPFPRIDPADPDAAIKIMWNHEYRPFATDDFRARNVTLETGTLVWVAPACRSRDAS